MYSCKFIFCKNLVWRNEIIWWQSQEITQVLLLVVELHHSFLMPRKLNRWTRSQCAGLTIEISRKVHHDRQEEIRCLWKYIALWSSRNQMERLLLPQKEIKGDTRQGRQNNFDTAAQIKGEGKWCSGAADSTFVYQGCYKENTCKDNVTVTPTGKDGKYRLLSCCFGGFHRHLQNSFEKNGQNWNIQQNWIVWSSCP